MSKPHTQIRVLYAKGGRSIAEARRLFPLAGQIPPHGPDQFLLAALHVFGGADFRLASVGPCTQTERFENGEAFEYGLRPQGGSTLERIVRKLGGLVQFCIDTFRFRPDVTLGGIEGPLGLAGLCISKILGKRFAFLVHTDIAAPSLSPHMKAINRFVIRHSDVVIVHGPFLYDRALQAGCKPGRLIDFDTGFDATGLIRHSDTASLDSSSPIFFYAGRIELDKGVLDLLKAFETVADEHSVQLAFAGDGGELQRLCEQTSVSRHSQKITVLGPIPHTELLERMLVSAAVVTPTLSVFPEGRCMSALESLLVGTPVIAPHFGAFPYLVQHGENGLTYQADSVVALAGAMRQLLQDKALLQQLQQGAAASGQALQLPPHTFLSRMRETAERFGAPSTP